MGLRDDPERLMRIGLEGLMRASECGDERVAAQAREMLREYRERWELWMLVQTPMLALWLKESPPETSAPSPSR